MINYLHDYGYDQYLKNTQSNADTHHTADDDGLTAARVIAEHKSNYIVATELGEMPGVLSGNYRYTVNDAVGSPTVGDFVMTKMSPEKDRAVIHRLMPRKTSFIRFDNFSVTKTQVLGANFDTVFICMSLNKNFNLSRLERYIAMAKGSGADMAVVLTKSDLCADAELQVEITRSVCGDIPVYAVSALNKRGLSELSGYFTKGKTIVALGSSGVGKSTLVNAFFGQKIMEVNEIRDDDDRGRHTTVHRQIILLPGGGLYMDTPGLREIGLVDAEDAVGEIYEDVEVIAAQCRFHDCTHRTEPGCAIKSAIKSGGLTQEKYEKYVRLKREAAFLMRKETRKMKQRKRTETKRHDAVYEE